MKILFPLGAFYPSQIGGPCNTLYWHTCELNKHDFKIEVVSTSLGIVKDRVPLNTFVDDKCGKVYYGSEYPTDFKTIYIILTRVKYADIIHLNSIFNFISIVTFFFTKIFYPSKRIFWSVRGELNHAALQFSSVKKKPLLFLYKRLYRKVVFHSTSDSETIDIKKTFPLAKVVQIPNLISPSKRIDSPIKQQLLFMGRIHPIKALDKLIEALNYSQQFKLSDFTLVIAGTYEERHREYYDKLINLVKALNLTDKVNFIGHVSGSEKEQLYAESYCLLLMSETENFGNVVIEALNQGTPVIASLGTPWAVLSKYKCGYHISNDPRSISKHIDEILKLDTDQYKMMRTNSVELVEKEFNIKNQIYQWINQYK